MKKLLFTLAAGCFLSLSANAQLWKLRKIEIGGGIGITQFFGDIGGYSNDNNILGLRDFTFRHTRFQMNAFARYRITDIVSARLGLMAGLFHSTDARGSNKKRGFEERTDFFEPSLTGEFYIIKNREENSFEFLKGKNTFIKSLIKSLDVYFFTGFGGLVYKVSPNNKLIPFVKNESGVTAVVPIGLGVNIIYSSKINLGIDFGARLTYSDNIDGFTSANSRNNDVYHIVNFTVAYKIKTGKKAF